MRKRLRSHEGANAVEFALVLPILVMLVFGIFTVGMSYNGKLAMANGVRDATRFGATLPEGDASPQDGQVDEAWLRQVSERAIGAANGNLGAVSGGAWNVPSHAAEYELCVALLSATNPEDDTDPDGLYRQMHWTPGNAPTFAGSDAATARCFDDGFPDTDARIQVFARAPGRVDVVFFRQDVSMTNTSVARWEPAR